MKEGDASGPVVQLVRGRVFRLERCPYTAKVAGSNLVR